MVAAWDKLVLATGSSPLVPAIKGNDNRGCLVYRTIEDLEAIQAMASDATVGVVVGVEIATVTPPLRRKVEGRARSPSLGCRTGRSAARRAPAARSRAGRGGAWSSESTPAAPAASDRSGGSYFFSALWLADPAASLSSLLT